MQTFDLFFPTSVLLFATDPSLGHGPAHLLNDIGLCVIVAAVLAFIANKLKQPALLAYLLAGVLIGPEIGFGFIADHETIEVISEIGLVLLLFIIGLEMDLKKLRASGKPVIATGITQFLICVALGVPFFLLLGFRIGDPNAPGGEFGLFYPQKALDLYDRGADFVFIPRLHSAAQIAQVIETALREGLQNARDEQIDHLSTRDEVLA